MVKKTQISLNKVDSPVMQHAEEILKIEDFDELFNQIDDVYRKSQHSQNSGQNDAKDNIEVDKLEKDVELDKDMSEYVSGESDTSAYFDMTNVTEKHKDSFEEHELLHDNSQNIFDKKTFYSSPVDLYDTNFMKTTDSTENPKIECNGIYNKFSKYLLDNTVSLQDIELAELLKKEKGCLKDNDLNIFSPPCSIIHPELNGMDLKNSKIIPKNCLPKTYKNLSYPASEEALISELYHRVYRTQYLWADQQNDITSTDPKNIWAYNPKEKKAKCDEKKDELNTNILELEHISRCFGGQYMQEVHRALYDKKPNDPPSGSPEYYEAAQNYALHGNSKLDEKSNNLCSSISNLSPPHETKSYKLLDNVVNRSPGYSSHAPTSAQPWRYLDNVVNKKSLSSHASTPNRTITFTELSLTKTTVSSNRLHLKAVNNFCQTVKAINSSYNQQANTTNQDTSQGAPLHPLIAKERINNEDRQAFEIGKRALAEKAAYMAYYINQKNPLPCTNTMQLIPQNVPVTSSQPSPNRKVPSIYMCHNKFNEASSVPPGFSSPPPQVYNIPDNSKITVKTTQVQYYRQEQLIEN